MVNTMRQRNLPLIFFLCAYAFPRAITAADLPEPGFIALADSESFDGWEHGGNWVIEDYFVLINVVTVSAHEGLAAETQARSLRMRERVLRDVVAKGDCWPHGTWGENLWCLAALYLNEKGDEANSRLRKRATEFIETTRKLGNSPAPTPEQPGNFPWTFFSLGDYVRTLCLFHAKSAHYPGRLRPETEAAMKEALWLWLSQSSRVEEAGSDDLFLLLGTENHDLNKRPNFYLVSAVLNEDQTYRGRKLADGCTLAEHLAAYTAFFREWPVSRARSGLWVEIGSNTYQKYSWPAFFNLHELAPDPVIRHRFGLLLDLALIEEAQISVKGRRGGGRSRASHGRGGFENYKALLYATEGHRGGSSHSKIIETSRYAAPLEAILLRSYTFPQQKPFVIRNRVLGELAPVDAGDWIRLAESSALVNYAYRTPHYLLGSTLQNPALSMPAPDGGSPTLKYPGISRQKRAYGMLLHDPSSNTISQIHPLVEHPGGGRPQHSDWCVQHENVILVQRIPKLGRSTLGSYNTGRLGMRFDGVDLTATDREGWIFATNGKAFAAVRFLDSGHRWDDENEVAWPADFAGPGDSTRILLHAGDVSMHESFAKFQTSVLGCPLDVTADRVVYRFGMENENVIEAVRYDPNAHGNFTLPLINGEPVNLRPQAAYQSPFLNGDFGDDKITVTVGGERRVLDFSTPAN